jgi:hypothetical protein
MFIAYLSSTTSSSVGAACFGCNTCRSYGAKYFHDRTGYKHLAPTELALSYVELMLMLLNLFIFSLRLSISVADVSENELE